VPTATENLQEESVFHKIFRANLRKIGQNILCTLKKLPASTSMPSRQAHAPGVKLSLRRRGGRSDFFRLRHRSCSKNFESGSGSENFSNL